jgi:hypothetical protein
MLFRQAMSVERGGIGLAPLVVETAAGRLKSEIAVEMGGSEVGAIA